MLPYAIESNKENMTPTSHLSSSSKLLNQYYAFESNIKNLKEHKDELINEMGVNENEYYKQFKKKEDLSHLVIEKDTILFKETSEINELNDLLWEKEQRTNSLLDNLNHTNQTIETTLVNNIFNMEVSSNSIKLRLSNDINIIGMKDSKGAYVFNKIICENKSNMNMNEILEKEYNQDPELMMLYAGFNII